MSEAVPVFDSELHKPTPQSVFAELSSFLQYAAAAEWPTGLTETVDTSRAAVSVTQLLLTNQSYLTILTSPKSLTHCHTQWMKWITWDILAGGGKARRHESQGDVAGCYYLVGRIIVAGNSRNSCLSRAARDWSHPCSIKLGMGCPQLRS